MKKALSILFVCQAWLITLCFTVSCSNNQQTNSQQTSNQPSFPTNSTPRPPIRLPEDMTGIQAAEPKTTEKKLQPLRTTPMSTEQVEQFLTTHYLPSIFSGYESSADESAEPFYGVTNWDHSRIEWHFSSIKQDSLLPRRFYVAGKRRVADNILPMEGFFTIDSMFRVEDENISQTMLDEEGFSALYTAKGNFEINEPHDAEEGGSNWGTVTIDLGVRQNQYPHVEGELDTWQILYKPGTYPSGPGFVGLCKGAGFQLKGYFTYYHISRTREILIANNLLMIINDILPDFIKGNTNVHINPKYRNLGWDDSILERSDNWWEQSGQGE